MSQDISACALVGCQGVWQAEEEARGGLCRMRLMSVDRVGGGEDVTAGRMCGEVTVSSCFSRRGGRSGR